MGSSSVGLPTTRVPGEPATRWYLSKATRRATRRTAALANELNMHSFRIHVDGTVTWTPRRENLAQAKLKAKVKPAKGEATDPQMREPSNRQRRSNARAAAHRDLMEKAATLRATFIIRRWVRLASSSTTRAQPQQQTTTTPTPPPLPDGEWQPLPLRHEHEGATGGATKRRAPFVNALAVGSPSGSHRDKREHVLYPPGLPPPSLPPSPPASPTPSPHPPGAPSDLAVPYPEELSLPNPTSPSSPSSSTLTTNRRSRQCPSPSQTASPSGKHPTEPSTVKASRTKTASGVREATGSTRQLSSEVAPLKAGYRYDTSGKRCEMCSIVDLKVAATSVRYGEDDLCRPIKTYYCDAHAAVYGGVRDPSLRSTGDPREAAAAASQDTFRRIIDKLNQRQEAPGMRSKSTCMREERPFECTMCNRYFPWLKNYPERRCVTCETIVGFSTAYIEDAVERHMKVERRGGDSHSAFGNYYREPYDYEQFEKPYDSD